MALVLIRGSGDVGSAVALRLREAGHRVVVHDEPRPAHARRGMALTDAFFEGAASFGGVRAKRARRVEDVPRMADCGHAIPISDADFAEVAAALRPDALVDARMRKHAAPEPLRGLARLAVGLGPGFVAGENADVVVETAWGDALGTVIRAGGARPLDGEPRAIDGHGRDRYVYAAVAGMFRTAHAIGDAVECGEEVATIAGSPVRAPLAGILRGLTHDGAEVRAGAKVLEVDPRGDPAAAFGVGERPDRIAAGVVAAVAEALGGR
jgi:xanthine dehydrogenase accessory factor